MTADEVLLKKKNPPENPLFPKITPEECKDLLQPAPRSNLGVLGKMINAYEGLPVKPYATVKNINPAGTKSKLALEVGVKISF